MPYYPFSAGSITLAEEMMSNYYHIAGGNQYPYSVSANNGFTLASATYNIGASTTVFQDAFCVNLHIEDSIASADKSLWYLINETTLADTASSIEFTGLNGDSAEEYRIFSNFVGGTNNNIRLIFNGDSAVNYGFQRLNGQSTAVSAGRVAGSSWWIGYIEIGVTNTNNIVSQSEIIVYAKTGNERLGLVNFLSTGHGDYIHEIYSIAQIWNNTADEITTIKIISQGDSFFTGTNIQIWGRG